MLWMTTLGCINCKAFLPVCPLYFHLVNGTVELIDALHVSISS